MTQQDTQILAACGRRLLQAQDGRGRRWPVVHCAKALADAGAAPAVAQACADGMARVVAAVQARAAVAQ